MGDVLDFPFIEEDDIEDYEIEIDTSELEEMLDWYEEDEGCLL